MRLEQFHTVFLAAASLLLVAMTAWCLAPSQRSTAHLLLAFVSAASGAAVLAYWWGRRRPRGLSQ